MSNPSDTSLFGRFLIENKIVSEETFTKAVEKQMHETIKNSSSESYRFIGNILLEDLGVFRDRLQLHKIYLVFLKYKEYIQKQHYELMQITALDKK